MADLGVPTTSELKKLKVVELKAKLQEFGLPISGLKADLIERLHLFYLSRQQQQQQSREQQTVQLQARHHSHEQAQPVVTTPVFPVSSPIQAKPTIPVHSAGVLVGSQSGQPMVVQLQGSQPTSVPIQSFGTQPMTVSIPPPGAQSAQVPIHSPGAQLKSPLQSPAEQVSPLHLPGAPLKSPQQTPVAQISPLRSPGAQKVSPLRSPGGQPMLVPMSSAVQPVQMPIHSPGALSKSPLQSPVSQQVSPLRSPGAQPMLVPISSPGVQPVPMRSPDAMSKSPLQSPVAQQVSPLQSPGLKSKPVFMQSSGAPQVPIPVQFQGVQPVQIPTQATSGGMPLSRPMEASIVQSTVISSPVQEAPVVPPTQVVSRQVTSEKVAPTQVTTMQVAPEKVAPEKVAPTHVAPIKEAPTQVTTMQVAPEKVAPTHVAPIKEAPTQVTTMQVAPEKVAPTHVAPIKETPTQVAPIQVAQGDESKQLSAVYKQEMSRSDTAVTKPSVTPIPDKPIVCETQAAQEKFAPTEGGASEMKDVPVLKKEVLPETPKTKQPIEAVAQHFPQASQSLAQEPDHPSAITPPQHPLADQDQVQAHSKPQEMDTGEDRIDEETPPTIQVPAVKVEELVKEPQLPAGSPEDKMVTDQEESLASHKEVTEPQQKSSAPEEVPPQEDVPKKKEIPLAEERVVLPQRQIQPPQGEVSQTQAQTAPPPQEPQRLPPHPPGAPPVLPNVHIPPPPYRQQLLPPRGLADTEMQERSAVDFSAPPPQIAPPSATEQWTEDSGIEMSEPAFEDASYEADQEAVAVERTETKSRKKKKKKKKKKQRLQATSYEDLMHQEDEVEVEYVPEQIDATDPNYRAFAKIFEAFKLSEEPVKEKEKQVEKKEEIVEPKKTAEVTVMEDSDDDDEEDKPKEDDKPKISKKKLRKMNRLSVAELKQLVPRPDVVEMHDVTAQDPKLLVFLKSCRNTVPVPRHWCFKRKYLQGKRGIIKPPFELPEFIKKTGIMEMREAMQEKEEQKTMKAKMREKIRPKMGKINIDYQKLHDAFFKWQTKPKMTIHGDLYYEGKEFETKLKEKKPGDLSEELRTALGMPTGPGSNLVPPPWLIAMQRYGPPPSYPNLKIPGLNAAIPEGASFGYHAGGWGKPPVDETGRPLYGDVFGTQQAEVTVVEDDDQFDKTPWGELESEEESEESSEEESEEEEDQTGLVTPADTGLVTPSGLTSIPAGMETPDMIELRKRKTIEEAMETGAEQPSLYTVLPEKRAAVGGAMMGSAHVYDINAAVQPGLKKVGVGVAEGIEVALDPSELELDPLAMQARYEEQMKERESQLQKEDLSDMVAEHAAKQQKKRKKATDSGKAAKKYKEFKF